MLQDLQVKCENMTAFIPTNLYIHGSKSHETMRFSRINIPDFLSFHIEDSIERLMREKENLTEEQLIKNEVYLYVDPFKMCYLTWPVKDENDQFTITLGPIITEHLTVEEIRFLGYKMKLGSDNVFMLESFYGIVPYFDKVQLARIASMFLDYLSAPSHLPRIIREDHSIDTSPSEQPIEDRFETFDFVKSNYANEAKLLYAIEIGNIEGIKAMTSGNSMAITLPTRFPSDPLRESKNLSITLNSISLRAALKGGLDESFAHNLSHNFAIQIENQTTREAILELNTKMMLTYAESVKKYALKNHSELIVTAISYIRRHHVDKINLSDIADHMHISREHLSRTFKDEMGMTVTDFIHKTKIEESCTLLTSKAYSISHIAYLFNYSSPTHYTKMFKRFMGLSPKQWQMVNLNI